MEHAISSLSPIQTHAKGDEEVLRLHSPEAGFHGLGMGLGFRV